MPPDEEKLVITASLRLRSPVPEGRLDAWLDVLRDGPFGALPWMLIADRFEPFDRARARAAAVRGEEIGFASREAGGEVEAKLWFGCDGALLGVYVPRACFPADGIERAHRTLEALLGVMPPAAHGDAFVDTIWDPHESEGYAFVERADLSLPVAAPFNRCYWILALPEQAHDGYARAALLQTPAAVVEERRGRVWLQLYGSPFRYDTPEAYAALRRAYGHLDRLAHERWAYDEPEDAIAGPLPERGDVVAGLELGAEVAGAMLNNLHRGVRVDGDREVALVTAVGGTPRGRSLDELKRELSYSLDGVSRCVDVYETPGGISVLIERAPDGISLIDAGAMPAADAMNVLWQLVDVVERAHAWEITLVGLHPATCHVERQAGRWILTGVAPRAVPFLLAMPPKRGGLCLAEPYAAPEAWRGEAAGSAADVFSICAIGVFLLTGRHPFPDLGAVLRGDIPTLPADRLGATLLRGLVRDPDARLTLPELRAALAAER